MFGRGSNYATSDEDGDVLSHSSAAPEPAARSDRRRRKRPSWRRWLRRGVLLALLGVLGCMAWFGHTDLRIAGPFTIAPKEPTDIRTAVEGVVESINVEEGTSVRAGQIVARLSDRELRSDLAKTEAEIRETAARIRLLETGPLSDEIDLARAAVTKAEGRVNYAETRQERAKVLFEERLRPRNEYDEARESVTLATNELAEAKGRLNVLLRGNRPEQIEAARAQMERLETEKRYIEQQLRLLTVVSPVSGIVATPARQLNEMRRTLVRKGDSLLKVYNPKLLTAQILISEREIEGVRVGQPVVLRTRAYPDREFRGKVTAIATTAQGSSGSSGSSAEASFIPSATTLSSGNKTILVITDFSNDQLQLKAEMTGHAKIYCGSRRVFDVVSRRIARTFKVEIWSWW
ncbi:MAG TPA: efflux RND transporter periplasmic adaptor subunit, partial [Bryobacteraceae bacterium]|nr:efflux RND transporter periplasmic adaptor subunit [Bryobacteraceae bacterium]